MRLFFIFLILSYQNVCYGCENAENRTWKILNRMKMCIFFLFCLNITFLIEYCPSEDTEDCCMFSRRQIKLNWPWSWNSKVFTPRLLMLVFPSGASVSVWIFCNSCMSPSVVLGVKRWISKSYSHCWKGFKYTKMLENQIIVGAEGFFWRTADSWTVQDKQGTCEQLSLNKQTQLRIIQVTTQY